MQDVRRNDRAARRAHNRRALAPALGALMVLAAPMVAAPAMAQVYIDTSVLEDLGPAENLPGLLHGRVTRDLSPYGLVAPPAASPGRAAPGHASPAAPGHGATELLMEEPAQVPRSRLHVAAPATRPAPPVEALTPVTRPVARPTPPPAQVPQAPVRTARPADKPAAPVAVAVAAPAPIPERLAPEKPAPEALVPDMPAAKPAAPPAMAPAVAAPAPTPARAEPAVAAVVAPPPPPAPVPAAPMAAPAATPVPPAPAVPTVALPPAPAVSEATIKSVSAAMDTPLPPAAPAAPPAPREEPRPAAKAPAPAPSLLEPPTKAAPTPAPAPAPAPADSVAAVPRTAAGIVSLTFAAEETALPPDAKEQLERVAKRLMDDTGAQAQILAYAGAPDGNTSRARRISLSRALAARSLLMDRGIASTRIEVRALGDQVPDGSPDRVDVRVTTP
ncbi:OmpA family protein [Novispirillum sp. DQ9]|uniref:OmpA family protein n=1 Tax=Novispirillum sp. DQ9 TaxID=3398612 RepID=UPI003C7B8EA5